MEFKSQLVQCPKGHIYDASLHASCPECAKEAGAALGYGGAGGGSFGATEAPGYGSAGGGSFGATEAPGYGGAGGGSFGATEAPGYGPAGGGNFGATEAPGYAGGSSSDGNYGYFGKTEAPGQMGGAYGGQNMQGNFVRTEPPAEPDHRGATPEQASPFAPTVIGEEDGTVAPVVGWLVCIDGPMKGSDYRIHEGNNYIGREAGDIRIPGDDKISRQNDSVIAFDGDSLAFYAGLIQGHNILKVNGQPTFGAVQIKDHDTITVGTTKLMFVALCGEKFSWKEV